MNLTVLLYFGGFSLILTGFYGVLTGKNLIRVILALGIMEAGVNLLLVTTGFKPKAIPPIIVKSFKTLSLPNFADPLPQALVLTSIVIGFGITALSLALIVKYNEENGTIKMDEVENSEEVVE
ncbi:MAG: cation:proton antiporter subunit C [Deltaproteobacteria bacterium]|jgi:multicomponent Na+:H+ antiporter subunit C|nr:cation:proton antiporter subunit C [Deltaproteobacteria bacterium]